MEPVTPSGREFFGGYLPDLPDQRDLLYAAPPSILRTLPVRFDRRDLLPPILNQDRIGSCVANAVALAAQFQTITQRDPDPDLPSRLELYYRGREAIGTVASDSGSQPRDVIKALASGVAGEDRWPYDISRFRDVPPSASAAPGRVSAILYQRVFQEEHQIKASLANLYPVIVGFSVYESFTSLTVERTGTVPMPGYFERQLGGHCVLVVGYDDATRRYLFANSYGREWGDGGFGTLPYAMLAHPMLSSDFWSISLTRDEA